MTRRLLDFLALCLVRALVGVMRAFPKKGAYFIARTVVRFFIGFTPRFKDTGRQNLEMVFPEKTSEEHERILEESFNVLARNLRDYATIPSCQKSDLQNVTGMEELRELALKIEKEQPGAGVLYLGPHFGSYEKMVQLWVFINRPIAILARAFGLPRLDAWWNAQRELHGNKMFGRKGGYREIVNRLQAGEDVVILFDQNVKKNYAVFVELFGIMAATTKTVGLAAIRTGCPLVFCAAIEKPLGKYQVFSRQLANPYKDPGSNDEKVHSITKELHECLEGLVKEHPEQWFWVHRRFKTRPEGEAETIYDN